MCLCSVADTCSVLQIMKLCLFDKIYDETNFIKKISKCQSNWRPPRSSSQNDLAANLDKHFVDIFTQNYFVLVSYLWVPLVHIMTDHRNSNRAEKSTKIVQRLLLDWASARLQQKLFDVHSQM